MSHPIIVERHMKAPPARVYRHLTTSESWHASLGGTALIEPSPGGMFRMAMPDGNTARGEFVELIENERVVFTWGWVDHPGVPPGSSTVTIELTPTDTGTLVRLTHAGLPEPEVSEHTMGWNHYMPGLAELAETGEPPSAV
jgi:uncharacterized protein YndB with AHSA1/START domain